MHRDHHHGPEMIGRLLAAEPSLCNREIGERLGVAERTVKGYVRQLKARLGIPPNHSRSRLILRLTAGQKRRPVPVELLTSSEKRVLAYVLMGNNRMETARLLGWTTKHSASSVGYTLVSIYDKLAADGLMDLVSRFCL